MTENSTRSLRCAVIMACFNRREATLRSLASLYAQEYVGEIRVFLVDDASTDGTAEAVLESYPSVNVIRTPGDYYWARSMATAEEAAIADDPDVLIWLNDDVVLDPDALVRILEAQARNPSALVGGAVRDPGTNLLTYGGSLRKNRHPLMFSSVAPAPTDQAVDALNGNFILVPRPVRERIGRIDGQYSHAYADYDYCQRARARQVDVILAAGTYGTCPENRPPPPPRTRREALARLHSRKGSPPSSQLRYLSRHGGREWFLYFLIPYLRIAVRPGSRPGPSPSWCPSVAPRGPLPQRGM